MIWLYIYCRDEVYAKHKTWESGLLSCAQKVYFLVGGTLWILLPDSKWAPCLKAKLHLSMSVHPCVPMSINGRKPFTCICQPHLSVCVYLRLSTCFRTWMGRLHTLFITDTGGIVISPNSDTLLTPKNLEVSKWQAGPQSVLITSTNFGILTSWPTERFISVSIHEFTLSIFMSLVLKLCVNKTFWHTLRSAKKLSPLKYYFYAILSNI